MDVENIQPEEDCQEQCGSIYLTSSGILVIHCTLCENKYNGYEDYVAHIEEHIAPDFFGKEESEIVHYENSEMSSAMQNYDSNSASVAEYEGVEYALDESEDIFEVALEQPDEVYYDGALSCDGFIEVERLDGEESVERNIFEVPNSVKSEASSNSIQNSETSTRELQRRLTSETRKRIHKCPHCEFSCNDRSNLLGHIKRHSNNKPHKCSECSKCFYTRTELKAHMRSHTGERPYLCTECGKAFGTSSKLSLHLKRHANLRDKECPMCDMKFYSSTRLRDHMTIHSEDRPLKCDLCEASFKAYSSLKNHRKLHENERKYKCPLCPATFNQNPGLYSHMKKKHSVVKNMETLDEVKVEIEEL